MSNLQFSEGDVLLGRYEIIRFHAAGGMQEVYVCYDRTLGRQVALKTPKKGVSDRRFRRGAEMGARVNHSNVAATFDYYEDDNVTFLIEEFIDGVDLGSRLASEFVYLDPALAAHAIHHVARALYEAHRVGICHRDFKPSNVMTSNDASMSVIKLTDFGIAKLAEAELAAEMALFDKDESTLTSSHTLLGAVPYMAPECWASWKTAGQAMDIWALGCVGFHLLAGVPPFGSGRAAIANVIKAEQRGAAELKRPEWFGRHASTSKLEAGLWDIIVACLEVAPDKRPSASEIVAACDSLCYPAAKRRRGIVQSFGTVYPNGGKGNFGYISDAETGRSWFFHGSDFFGSGKPASGQRVCFSIYPGAPHARSAPVLLIR